MWRTHRPNLGWLYGTVQNDDDANIQYANTGQQ